RFYSDYLKLFDEEDLDGVVVAAPPDVHAMIGIEALGRGLHLFTEKPPAMTMEEGRQCAKAILDSGVITAVGFQLRYSPLYERLKKLVQGETIHLVRTVCTIDYYLNFGMSPWFLQKEISGGPIAEQAIHLLDCVRYLLGDPRPVQTATLGVKNMAMERTEFNAENALQMIYELEGDIRGIHTNHCGHDKFAFDLELIGPHLRLHANTTDAMIKGFINSEEIGEPAPIQNQLSLDKTGAWLRAIETGDRTLIRSDYENALLTLELVEAAARSLEENRIIQCKQ
ncbi:MAG: Gfo/Idh/MocA family oxidoreductase, partial [Planctomycetota bacterium]|nr:Gfo/Idh/MocA family oxidoreductase [Planctomycetota bacterium]